MPGQVRSKNEKYTCSFPGHRSPSIHVEQDRLAGCQYYVTSWVSCITVTCVSVCWQIKPWLKSGPVTADLYMKHLYI